jgi:hypothetical protein
VWDAIALMGGACGLYLLIRLLVEQVVIAR